jgi:hypothetical protein
MELQGLNDLHEKVALKYVSHEFISVFFVKCIVHFVLVCPSLG